MSWPGYRPSVKHFLWSIILASACGGSKPAASPPVANQPEPPPAAEAPPASPASEALAQAALTEQYELGKKLYGEKKCATCHGDHGEGNPKNPPVIGDAAFPEAAPAAAKLRKGITFKTAADVASFVRTKMPLKAPGTLTDDEAAAVTAWMLSESKVGLTAKLDASNAGSIKLR
jgi:mono/diheme cytochrome c family protein